MLQMIRDIQTVLDNNNYRNGTFVEGSWCRATQHAYTGWANRHNHPTHQPANREQLDETMLREIDLLHKESSEDLEEVVQEPERLESSPKAGYDEIEPDANDDDEEEAEGDLTFNMDDDDDDDHKMMDDISGDEFDG